MKIVIITFVVIMIFASSLESTCIPKSGECNVRCSKDCCTKYCRDSVCVQFGESSDDAETRENPCNGEKCPPGQECVLSQVQCIRAPCGPVSECVNSTAPSCPV